MKPFLRWAGSKRQLVQRLRTFWSPHFKRYVEPFAGSSALFFEIEPSSALLADKNPQLVEAYEVIRRAPRRLHARLSSLPVNKATYYSVRSENPSVLSQFRRAVRFIYLNRFCFNGLHRTNLRGEFNVPYSPTKTGGFPSVDHFETASELLQGAAIRCWDFGTTLRYVREGDFVYLDPPYAVQSRRVFREYGSRLFCTCDLARLGRHLTSIDARGAYFVMSYADCVEARRIAKPWHNIRLSVRRHIAGFEDCRRRAFELLITNIQPEKARYGN